MSYRFFDSFTADPANWRMGFLYFCPDDRRVVAPRRSKAWGWTLNFARPATSPLLVIVLLTIGQGQALVSMLGAVTWLVLGTKAMIFLSMLVLCWKLGSVRRG